MNVPLLDLNAQHQPIRKDLLAAMERVLDKGDFILGAEVKRLEEQVAAYCHTQYAVGVSSGTDALLVAAMALGIGPGDEVITTAFSFFATSAIISRLGAKPVFVDIDPVTYNLDPGKIEKAITEKTRAIIPVHLYGQCADMDPVLALAAKHGINVIEDAAQAIGAEYRDGRRAGSMGKVGCLSFFPSKNLGAFGDGGMVVTNDEEVADKIRLLRIQGGRPKYFHKVIGGNFRLDTLQASVLNVKLPYLDRWTAMRQQNAIRYEELIRHAELPEKVGLCLPQSVYRDHKVSHYHIYNQFILRVPNRDGLRTFLSEKGIGTEIYYPMPLHLQECYKDLGYREGTLPVAEAACKETVGLPVFPELTQQQQEYVVETIKQFYQNRT